MKDNKFLEKAFRLALENDENLRHHLGAVIVKGGAIRSTGWNKINTPPNTIEGELTAEIFERIAVHAEMDALKQCGSSKGATVYVARATPGGRRALARPCVRCQQALRLAEVQRVVYTISNNEYGVLNLRTSQDESTTT